MRKPIRSSEMFFFSDDTPTPEIYTLSLHDALPISKKAEDDRDDPHFPSRILAWAIRVPVPEYGVVQTVEPVRGREMRFDCDLCGGIWAPRPKRSVLGNR